MRTANAAVVVVVAASLAAPALAGGAPKPPAGRTPEAIDYSKPERYADIPKSEGDAARIRKLAAPLRDDDLEQTIRNVHAFVADRVPHVPSPTWEPDARNFDQLVRGFDHRGCAEHALVFADLLRAAGIPAVYVKSSRHEWIRKYVANGETGSFDGHVFLEVFVRGKWRLLDAQGMRIWDDHDPSDPELPGGLLAYEKGSDHFAMVHSTQRDRFIEEAKARWKGFDVSQLRRNEDPGRALLPRVYAVTLAGEWKVLEERIAGLASFDLGYWAAKKGEAKGAILVVTSVGGRVAIPDDEAEAWLPVKPADLFKDFLAGRSETRTRRLDDGTLVVLVSARGWRELMTLIWSTDFESLRAGFAKGK